VLAGAGFIGLSRQKCADAGKILETTVSLSSYAFSAPLITDQRLMVRAELMGSRSHISFSGVKVHLGGRGGKEPPVAATLVSYTRKT
jgi:hypothetical protein